MAKNESTAVNDLIEMVAGKKPLAIDPTDELMFGPRAPAPPPLPRHRTPSGTDQGLSTAGRPVAAMTMQGLGPAFAAPMPTKSAVQPGFSVPAMPKVPARITAPVPARATAQVQPAPAAPVPWAAAPITLDLKSSQVWFDQMTDPSEYGQHEEAWVGTIQVKRRTSWKAVAARLAGPLFVLMVAGVFAGGYLVFDGEGGKPRGPTSRPIAAAAAPLAPAPAPAPPAPAPAVVPAPAPTPTPTPSKFVDIMIVSSPAGATVTLVDRGKTTFIGTTPIATALDPSRKYELVFSHPSKPTRIESIDPAATRRVDVKLGRPGTAAAAP